jgi:hypothetical protein
MTPNELYQRTPERIEPLIGEDGRLNFVGGCYYDHIPELDRDYRNTFNQTDRIVCKVYKHFDFDFRRFWRLASIWMDGEPVMIIQNAGREGDDHATRFITDLGKYREMVRLLRSLQWNVTVDDVDVVHADEVINNLDSFYGNYLDGPFERY